MARSNNRHHGRAWKNPYVDAVFTPVFWSLFCGAAAVMLVVGEVYEAIVAPASIVILIWIRFGIVIHRLRTGHWEPAESRCGRCVEKALCLKKPPVDEDDLPPNNSSTAAESLRTAMAQLRFESVDAPYSPSASPPAAVATVLGNINNYNVFINGNNNYTTVIGASAGSYYNGMASNEQYSVQDPDPAVVTTLSPYHEMSGAADINTQDHYDDDNNVNFISSQLRTLESEANELFELHSELESHLESTVDDPSPSRVSLPERLTRDAHELKQEAEKIRVWIQRSGSCVATTTPTHRGGPPQQALDTTSYRLRRIRLHFNVYRRQLGLLGPEFTTNSSTPGVHRAVSSDSSLPPSYSMCVAGQTPRSSRINDHPDPVATSSGLASTNQRQSSRSLSSLAPPPVDLSAPPSYDQLRASQMLYI